jgi:hypothetical protein
MLRRLHNDQVSGLMLLALGVFVAVYNRSYPLGTLQEPGPGYTPLLLAIFLAVIGFLICLRGRASPALNETRWPEGRRALVILVACGVATYALEEVGYRITIAALLIFFLGVVERRNPLTVATIAVGFSIATYYLLALLLRVPLPRSPWGI